MTDIPEWSGRLYKASKMNKAIIPTKIADALYAEVYDSDLEIWKQSKLLAIKKHLHRGEIMRRYIKQFDLGVNATVILLAERGISESGLKDSLYIFDNYWQGDIESSIAKLPEGDNITVRKLLGEKKETEEEPDTCRHCPNHCPPPRKSIGGGKI